MPVLQNHAYTLYVEDHRERHWAGPGALRVDRVSWSPVRLPSLHFFDKSACTLRPSLFSRVEELTEFICWKALAG